MSSTNRSNARDSHVSDYYVTPVEDIKLFLEHFVRDDNIELAQLNILDPCAGGDLNNPMSYPQALGVPVTTMDIREDSLATLKADYLTTPVSKYDLIITNPPFNIALDIIKKALEDVTAGGYVVMLLRLNFFGSKARKQFFNEYMPIRAYVHHKRISFTKGQTDSIEYMHCVWKKGAGNKETLLKII